MTTELDSGISKAVERRKNMDTEKKDILILAIEVPVMKRQQRCKERTTGVVKCDLITDRST